MGAVKTFRAYQGKPCPEEADQAVLSSQVLQGPGCGFRPVPHAGLPPTLLNRSPPALHQPRITQIIIWLLQHFLVIQLHAYVTLALDEGITTCFRSISQEELAMSAAVGLGLNDRIREWE